MKRICPHCKNSFTPKRRNSIYCSPSHKQMAYLERKLNLSSNKRDLDSIALSKHYSDPSINRQSKNDYPSIDGLMQDEKNLTKTIYPSIDGSEHNQKPSIDLSNVEYQPYQSAFIDALYDLTNERDNVSKLNPLFWHDNSGTYLWISTRFKCLVECLLLFSEKKTIELDDLKEICNAFTLMMGSNYFQSLPKAYPYANDILELRQSLKKICTNADENEPLRFRLKPQNKNKLIATRWELQFYVPKVTFSELNFKE